MRTARASWGSVWPRGVLASCLAILALGCSGKDPYNPGTPIGTFHVTAKLLGTTCGATPNPWGFDVKINYDKSTLYWIQGGAPVNGDVNATSAQATLTTTSLHELRAADPKRSACSVSRRDVLSVTLAGDDASPSPDPAATTSFGGNLVYTFAPVDGADCADQLLSTQGDFETLPCEVQYEVTGVLTERATK